MDVTDFNSMARSCCTQHLIKWNPDWTLQDPRPSGKLVVELRFGDHGSGGSGNGYLLGGGDSGGGGGGPVNGGGTLNGGGTTGSGGTDVQQSRRQQDDANGNGVQGLSTDSSGSSATNNNSSNNNNNNNHAGAAESAARKFDWKTRRDPRPVGEWLKGRGNKAGDANSSDEGTSSLNKGSKNNIKDNDNSVNDKNRNGRLFSLRAEQFVRGWWQHVYTEAQAPSSSSTSPWKSWHGFRAEPATAHRRGAGVPPIIPPRRW